MRSIKLYRELTESKYSEAEDWAALATMMMYEGKHEEAKTAVQDGMHTFPEKVRGFVEVGMDIVGATGDIEFRDELRNYLEEEE